jgi:hypothetical protein
MPHGHYYAHGRTFAAAADGLLEVPSEFVAALVAGGCVLLEPHSSAPPPKVEPPKPPERVPTIWVKGPPGMAFAPVSGSTIRYRMSGDGYCKVFPEHVAAMRNAGAEVVMEAPAQLAEDNAGTCHHIMR